MASRKVHRNVEMDLADLECYGVENPNARLSCFVNKVFIYLSILLLFKFNFLFKYLMITCEAHLSLTMVVLWI